VSYKIHRRINEPITVPRHEPVKKVYVELVRAVIEREEIV